MFDYLDLLLGYFCFLTISKNVTVEKSKEKWVSFQMAFVKESMWSLIKYLIYIDPYSSSFLQIFIYLENLNKWKVYS